MQFIYCLVTLAVLVRADYPCNERTTEYGTVCVCNSTYCDTVPELLNLTSGQYQLYTTSKSSLGFTSSNGTFSNSTESASVTVTVANLSTTYQSIYGFGGAFTDATGINIANLSEASQELLLQAYFGVRGIQYSICRVPIGGTDFSLKGYTYLDEEDETLDSFALQSADFDYKIPYIQRAMEIRGKENIRFVASAWTAPKWMKTNNAYNGIGRVKDEYYTLWAQYYIRFFEEYEKNNISFWGVTTQNEPVDGILGTTIQNNGFTSSQMKTWVKEALGPIIRNSSYSDLKIMLHDDQRVLLPILHLLVLSDSEVLNYADGIAVHFYTDEFVPASLLNLASSSNKSLFRLATEACAGSYPWENAVELGSWDRANQYLSSIFDDLSYDFVGWIDWNMALNETGGPTWIDNEVDSPIIVNGTADEFYKQPMFYALGHFSKFIVTDSVRVEIEQSGLGSILGLQSLAFWRPDGKVAVVLKNTLSSSKTVKLDILGSTEVFTIEAYSINTLLYTI